MEDGQDAAVAVVDHGPFGQLVELEGGGQGLAVARPGNRPGRSAEQEEPGDQADGRHEEGEEIAAQEAHGAHEATRAMAVRNGTGGGYVCGVQTLRDDLLLAGRYRIGPLLGQGGM